MHGRNARGVLGEPTHLAHELESLVVPPVVGSGRGTGSRRQVARSKKGRRKHKGGGRTQQSSPSLAPSMPPHTHSLRSHCLFPTHRKEASTPGPPGGETSNTLSMYRGWSGLKAWGSRATVTCSQGGNKKKKGGYSGPRARGRADVRRARRARKEREGGYKYQVQVPWHLNQQQEACQWVQQTRRGARKEGSMVGRAGTRTGLPQWARVSPQQGRAGSARTRGCMFKAGCSGH